MRPPAPSPSRLRSLLTGIGRVARGRPDGLLLFGDTSQAVMAALTPLAAFLVVMALLGTLRRSAADVGDVAMLAVLWLAPLVISFEFARRWDRAGQWFRFAAAFCWCQVASPLALLVVSFAATLLVAGGLGEGAANVAGLLCLALYGLWLNWFLARYGLGISGKRATVLVLAVNVVLGGLILLPVWLNQVANGSPPS